MRYSTFKELPFGAVFAMGVTVNSPTELYMTDQDVGRLMKWVAKKGRIDDWAIYVQWDDWSYEEVLSNGDKLTNKTYITSLVPCDDEMMEHYRF